MCNLLSSVFNQSKFESNLAKISSMKQYFAFFLGCNDKAQWEMWKKVFHCDYFKVNCVEDGQTVEICGALKVSEASREKF